MECSKCCLTESAGEPDRQRQTDRQTDRRTDGQTDRRTECILYGFSPDLRHTLVRHSPYPLGRSSPIPERERERAAKREREREIEIEMQRETQRRRETERQRARLLVAEGRVLPLEEERLEAVSRGKRAEVYTWQCNAQSNP